MSCDNKNNYNINCCGPLKRYYLIPSPVGPTGPTGSTHTLKSESKEIL